MATSCAEYLSWKDLEQILENAGSTEYGDAGESSAHVIAREFLDMTATDFRKADHGFDDVLRDQNGRLVVMEVKTTHGDPLQMLENRGKPNEQMGKEWTQKRAMKMCDPNSALCADNPANTALGEEILQKGVENVRRILIHVDPVTHGVDYYEVIGDQWQKIHSFSGKEIDEALKPEDFHEDKR